MGALIKYPKKVSDAEKKASKRRYEIQRQVWMEPDMFYSVAFMSLSGKAKWVLLRFRQKRVWSNVGKGRKAKHIYTDNNLVFTYGEAYHFKISQSQFHSIIKKLVELGFIDVEHQGGFYGRDYSRYCLSERWRDFGKPSFCKVEKERVLQAGLDVRSHQKKKLENATGSSNHTSVENRSCSQSIVFERVTETRN